MRFRLVLAVSCAAFFLGAASAQAYIFWSSYDSANSRVGRAGLDGSDVRPELVTGIYFGAGVATDGEHVYWGESGSNPKLATIGRATVDGGEVSHAAYNAATYCGVFGVRATASDLYWLKNDCSGLSINTRIDREPKGGGGYAEVGAGSYICGFDVDANYVYWSEGHYIARAPNTVPPSLPEKTWLDVGEGFTPCAVAVDSEHVFWTNAGPAPEETGYRGTSIGRASITGDPKSVDHELIVGVSLFSGGGTPDGLAVDGGFLYWLNQPAAGQLLGSVGRANTDGTGVDYSFIDDVFYPFSLDVDSQGPHPSPALTTPKTTRPPPVPPRIVGVNTSNSHFGTTRGATPAGARAARKPVPKGTVFGYSLDQDAAVVIEIKKVKAGRVVGGKCKKRKKSNAKKKKCDLLEQKLTRSGKAGKNEVPYTGTVKGKTLKVGRYVAVFTATSEGGRSNSASVGFKIVKP